MSWTEPLMSPALVKQPERFEVTITRRARSQEMIGPRPYDMDLFDGDLITPMIKAHPKVWTGDTLVENPFYPNPEPPEPEEGLRSRVPKHNIPTTVRGGAGCNR
jgi:hypothetical protein